MESWSGRQELLTVVPQANSLADIKRRRVYRSAAAAAKREIYHRLRRYRPSQESADEAVADLEALPADASAAQLLEAVMAVAASHVSTAERLEHIGEFFEALTRRLGTPQTVVDVGCGVLPLLYPLDEPIGASVQQLWGLDSDIQAIHAVSAYATIRADDRVNGVRWDFTDGWSALAGRGLPARFDAGLLLKVIPVVARRDPRLLAMLAATPASLLAISGSRTAMTKRQSIERREADVLRRFLNNYNFTVRDEFRTADEICFIAERP